MAQTSKTSKKVTQKVVDFKHYLPKVVLTLFLSILITGRATGLQSSMSLSSFLMVIILSGIYIEVNAILSSGTRNYRCSIKTRSTMVDSLTPKFPLFLPSLPT
jgi:hypothetical protein